MIFEINKQGQIPDTAIVVSIQFRIENFEPSARNFRLLKKPFRSELLGGKVSSMKRLRNRKTNEHTSNFREFISRAGNHGDSDRLTSSSIGGGGGGRVD